MIRYISLRNFRAFRQQSFHFSRINVFVGANNSGKSSALSAINLLAQSVLSAEIGGSPLVLNGQFEQLGTFIDTVHGNRSNTPIGITFGYGQSEVELEFKYRSQRREIEVSRFVLSRRGAEVYSRKSNKDGVKTNISGLPDTQFRQYVNAPDQPREAIEHIGFWPQDHRFRHLRLRRDASTLERHQKEFQLVERLDRELSVAWYELRAQFLSFDALGAFRDPPQRTYLYTGETAAHVGKTGSNSITQLINDASKRGSQSAGYVDEVSRWLSATAIADRLTIRSLTPRHFEVCIVGHDGTVHNICDVGFGCSQVLPVIVGGLSAFAKGSGRDRTMRPSEPVFLVQEPEIHLHPNAQASLASFFVGQITKLKRGQLFVETHSDNFVLRLARHVALGDLEPGDVAVFIIRDENGEKIVRTVRPNEQGVFEPEWPGGFFPQRQTESLALAKARMRPTQAESQGQLEFKYPEEL